MAHRFSPAKVGSEQRVAVGSPLVITSQRFIKSRANATIAATWRFECKQVKAVRTGFQPVQINVPTVYDSQPVRRAVRSCISLGQRRFD